MRTEFGPFLADADRGELFKYGKRLRVRAQPFQVLIALLEKPGRSSHAKNCTSDCGASESSRNLRLALIPAVSRCAKCSESLPISRI